MKATLIKKIEQEVELERGQIFENTSEDKYVLVPSTYCKWLLINLSTGKKRSEEGDMEEIKIELENNGYTFVGNLSEFELVKKEV